MTTRLGSSGEYAQFLDRYWSIDDELLIVSAFYVDVPCIGEAFAYQIPIVDYSSYRAFVNYEVSH